MKELQITDIFAILSSAVAIIAALAVVFKKIRRHVVTHLASLIDVSDLNRTSSLYKTLTTNNDILSQITNINNKNMLEFGKINEHFLLINRTLLRLELITAMDHKSNDATIYKLYEEYKKMGGNSYMDKLMKDWEKGDYLSVDKIIDNTISKKLNK